MVIVRLTTNGREGLPTFVFSNKNVVMAVLESKVFCFFDNSCGFSTKGVKDEHNHADYCKTDFLFL